MLVNIASVRGIAKCSRAPFFRPTRSINIRLTDAGRRYQSSDAEGADHNISHNIKERRDGIRTATLTVSNPAKLNIISSSLLQRLASICCDLARDGSLRAVVLTGGPTTAGKSPSFIGGADINEMAALTSAAEAKTFITRIHNACSALRALPVPIIARIDGLCLGAGLEIAAACDLRLATERSLFAMPEVRIGIPSVVEAALLPGLIGMGRTRRLLYLAESVGAAEAERWGLVEKVVKNEVALDEAVDSWVERICEMGPKAIRLQKVLMQRWENCTVHGGIQAGIETFAEAYNDCGTEPKEYMGAFLTRKK